MDVEVSAGGFAPCCLFKKGNKLKTETYKQIQNLYIQQLSWNPCGRQILGLIGCLLTRRTLKRRCPTNNLKATPKQKRTTPRRTKKHAGLDPEAPRGPAPPKDPEEPGVETEAESALQTEGKLEDGAGHVPMMPTAGGGERTGRSLMTGTGEGRRRVGSRGEDHDQVLAESGSHARTMRAARASRRKERSRGRMERKNLYHHPRRFHHLLNLLMRVQREKWKHKCRKVRRAN